MPHGATSTKILKFQIGGIMDPTGIPVGLPLGRRLQSQEAILAQEQVAVQQKVRELAAAAATAAGQTQAQAQAAGEAAAQAVADAQAQAQQHAGDHLAALQEAIAAAQRMTPAQQQALAQAQAAAHAKAQAVAQASARQQQGAGGNRRAKVGPLAAAIRRYRASAGKRRGAAQGRRLSMGGGSTKRTSMEWWGGVAVLCTPPMLCMCIKWQQVPPPVFYIPIPVPCTKIYTIPYAGQVVMIINPPGKGGVFTYKGNSKCKDAPQPGTCNLITCNFPPKQMCPIIDRSSIKVGGAGKRTGWSTGILVGSSIMTRIYALPWMASTVLVINPASNSASTFGNFKGSFQWAGGKSYTLPHLKSN